MTTGEVDWWHDLIDKLETELRERASGTPASDPADRDAPWRAFHALLHACAQMVQRWHPDLSDGEADDLVQTVLLRYQSVAAVRELRSVQAPRRFFAIALRNAYRDGRRRAAIAHGAEGRVRERLYAEHETDTAEAVDAGRVEKLRAIIDALPAADRQLLDLIYWRKQPLATAGRTINVSPSTLAVRLFRLRQRIAELLGESK